MCNQQSYFLYPVSALFCGSTNMSFVVLGSGGEVLENVYIYKSMYDVFLLNSSPSASLLHFLHPPSMAETMNLHVTRTVRLSKI